MLDRSKMQYYTEDNTYKNNAVYTGSFTISGTSVAGTTTKSFGITLARRPDIMDVMFQGASDTHWEGTYGDNDPRPDAGWFKKGAVWVRGDDAGAGYTDYPCPFVLYTALSGLTLTVTAIFSQQFIATLSLTPTVVNYKIVDYSVF